MAPRLRKSHLKNLPAGRQASPIYLTLLLVKFILTKIGHIPIFVVLSSLFVVRRLLRVRRNRGRPRTTPLIKFHLRKFKKQFYSKVPSKAKIGIALASIFLAFYLYTSLVVNLAYQLPSPKSLSYTSSPLTTEVYDRNGNLLYRFYEGQNRSLIKLEDLPKHLIQATLAAEDKNFYSHPGFDLLAIVRATYHNLNLGSTEGASTITQQLIKNSLLTSEKTLSRKIKEIFLAFWAERIYSKNEILEMYFNQAPYGGTAWGIEAASLSFFGKSARDLTLAEGAFLAGLPASPTQFSPFSPNPSLAKERQAWVLNRMVQDGFITKKTFDEAKDATLDLKPQTNDILAPHFVFYVRNYLTRTLGSRMVSQGGLKVTTTLDLELQLEVEKILKQEVESLGPLNVKNGAAMVTDPKTGQILAMVGSRDYRYPLFGNFNATLALRQPGSSIKVVTYSEAFKQGFTPGNTILDTPVTFKSSQAYSPSNYDGRFHGPVSIRTALGSSYNVPAVKMLATVGLEAMIQTGRDMGLTTWEDKNRFGLSLTLGGGEVKMIDMMAVYGTLAQMGVKRPIVGILKVTDSKGNVLEEYTKRGEQVLKPQIAYLLTDILKDNQARTPAFGPSSLLNIPGYQVAVKTGTSDNKRDNWTFGYTPEFVVGVWVGNNDNSLMHPSLTSGITGATPIWNKITKLLTQKMPGASFVRPKGIIEAKIDGRRDLVISDILPKGLTQVKKQGDKTIFLDTFSSYATSSAQEVRLPQAAVRDGTTN